MYERPSGLLYAPDMARIEWAPVEKARAQLGQRVKLAKDEKVHTVLTMRGNPDAVIVPMSWYRTKMDEPIEYVPAFPDEEEPAEKS